MALKGDQIVVPADGSAVSLGWGESLSVRNTGVVTVLVGGSDADCVFPLGANAGDSDLGEFLALDVSRGGEIVARVKTAGVAGQVTVLTVE